MPSIAANHERIEIIMSLENKVVLITGAGRGIGRATAEHLANAGAAVGVLSRTAEQVHEVAHGIRERGGRALAVTADVTIREQVFAAIEKDERELGVVDV